LPSVVASVRSCILIGRMTVPHAKRDRPIGALRSIERQSGVTLMTR
jgi:hypothetical protein